MAKDNDIEKKECERAMRNRHIDLSTLRVPRQGSYLAIFLYMYGRLLVFFSPAVDFIIAAVFRLRLIKHIRACAVPCMPPWDGQDGRK